MVKRYVALLFVLIGTSLICLSSCGRKLPEPLDDSQSTLTWQEQYDLGVRYLSEGNYEEAVIAFTAAIKIEPNLAPAYVGRGDAYILASETEANLAAAQADYERAIELDDTNALAYLGLADVYIKQGVLESALTALQRGLERTDGNIKISNKINEIEQMQSETRGKMVLTLQVAYEADGTPRSYWKYVYNNDIDNRGGAHIEYRHYQKDGSYDEGIAPYKNETPTYMLTNGTGEFVPVICLDPLLEEGKRELVKNGSNNLYNIAGTNTYAIYTFDECDNPVAISSYLPDGTLTGTAVLEWSFVGPDS